MCSLVLLGFRPEVVVCLCQADLTKHTYVVPRAPLSEFAREVFSAVYNSYTSLLPSGLVWSFCSFFFFFFNFCRYAVHNYSAVFTPNPIFSLTALCGICGYKHILIFFTNNLNSSSIVSYSYFDQSTTHYSTPFLPNVYTVEYRNTTEMNTEKKRQIE